MLFPSKAQLFTSTLTLNNLPQILLSPPLVMPVLHPTPPWRRGTIGDALPLGLSAVLRWPRVPRGLRYRSGAAQYIWWPREQDLWSGSAQRPLQGKGPGHHSDL